MSTIYAEDWGLMWIYMCKEMANINTSFPHSLLRIYSTCTIHRTGTEKGNRGKRQQMSIAAVPMPDYSSSPQTGGGCDLTRSTYVFPCIQDARHWLVVQLGPGQGRLNTVWFNMVSMCSPMFNVVLQKLSLCIVEILRKTAVSWMKRTTKQTKENKREWGREKGVEYFSLVQHENNSKHHE